VRWGALALLVGTLGGCGGSHSVSLVVAPDSTQLDQTVSIRVSGTKPGSEITIVAEQSGWASRGVYRADGNGTIDVARDRSLSGTYTGRDAMGLFWSMRPPTQIQGPTPFDGGRVTIAALAGGRRLAVIRVDRTITAQDVSSRELTVARDRLFGRYFAPPNDGLKHPAVVVFGGSEGGLHSTQDAGLLAAHGFPALALAYFREPGLPKELSLIPLEYFARAVAWLGRQPGVDPQRVFVEGVSRGSEAALEVGVHYPTLVHGVIAVVPSAQVFAGLASSSGQISAWTFDGRPLPFTGAAATIPVERVHGPILASGGGQDLLWASYYYAKDIAERSRRLHGPPVSVFDYPNAGHFWSIPNVPSGDHYGGTRAANAAASADLWPRILRFVARA
jgi:dienelactone hydrolase